MTMFYIIVVNPLILVDAGMPRDGVMMATCLAAAMGLKALFRVHRRSRDGDFVAGSSGGRISIRHRLHPATLTTTTAETLVGVASKIGLLDDEGRLPRARGALMADALATCAGALFGTSTTTT